jgi:hypothetical protein
MAFAGELAIGEAAPGEDSPETASVVPPSNGQTVLTG